MAAKWGRKGGNVRYPGLWVAGLAVAGFLVTTAPVAEADAVAADNAALQQEIGILKNRLAQLENRLSAQESRPQPVYASTPSEPSAGEWINGVKVSGSLDVTAMYNFNEPNGGTNTLRVFDRFSQSFTPNLAELVFEKPVSEESRTGFRIDLDYGDDAEVFGSAGLGSTTDEIDLQQAYAEVLAPWGNGLDFKFGKFVTTAGSEVIESKDNWNTSRSFLFGYAIPFTHTGFRAEYKWNDWLSTIGGVNNGWDVVDDTNKGKTSEVMVKITPAENVFVASGFHFGPEQAGDTHDTRYLFDNVVTWNPTDKLKLMANYDFGYEDDGVREGTEVINGENASWQGVAGYARYQFKDWWAWAARAEFFKDADGARTATIQNLWELTLTNEFVIYKDLIGRLEYRYDKSNESVYTIDKGTSNDQSTISWEMIYAF